MIDIIPAPVAAFWQAWGDLIITVAGACLVVIFVAVIRYAVKAARSTSRSRLVAGYVFTASLFWMAEGQFELMTRDSGFDVPWYVALLACGIFEGFLAQAYYQAEEYRRDYGTPGPAGPRMWAIGLAGATVAASAAATGTEFLFRMSVPTFAVWGIWTVLRAPRADDPPEVIARRREEERRRRGTWNITPRRVAVFLRVMRPDSLSETDAERERRVRRMAALGTQIAASRPADWEWAHARRVRALARLARQADDDQIRDAAIRVLRARRASDVIAHGRPLDPPPTWTTVPWDPATGVRRLDSDAMTTLAQTITNGHRDAPPRRTPPRRTPAPRMAARRTTDDAVRQAAAAVRAGGVSQRQAARDAGITEAKLRRHLRREREN